MTYGREWKNGAWFKTAPRRNDCLRWYHWRRPVYGCGQYDYDGWSVSPLVLRIDGCRHVLHHAHYGGNALSGTGNGLLCNVWS